MFVYILIMQGSEWKEKTEKLELELQQCYKAQSRLSEQLVIEVAESRTSKASLQDKELLINDLEKDLSHTRFRKLFSSFKGFKFLRFFKTIVVAL